MEIVGYLLEELRDAKNFEAFKADVASANIFIGSLIFIEELADKASLFWGAWGAKPGGRARAPKPAAARAAAAAPGGAAVDAPLSAGRGGRAGAGRCSGPWRGLKTS